MAAKQYIKMVEEYEKLCSIIDTGDKENMFHVCVEYVGCLATCLNDKQIEELCRTILWKLVSKIDQ